MTHPRFGVGFRTQHFEEVVRAPRAVDWFEILSDNFIGVGGGRRAMLERLRADYPLLLHGVSLSIAGVDPLSDEYLRGLRALVDWLDPPFVSDHLCWTALGGHQSHDLLPVAYTGHVLDHVAARVMRVQEVLGRRLLLENASAYIAFRHADMSEVEFFAALCRRTGCGMVLDVNNLYVNAPNLGLDPAGYLAQVPDGVVGYMHLAGHAVLPDVRIDTHDADVPQPVWALFAAAVRRFPDAGVIIERDDNLPPFAQLVREVERARVDHHAVAAAGRVGAVPMRERTLTLSDDVAAVRPWDDLQREFWARLVDQPAAVDPRDDTGLAALFDDGRPVSVARGMRVYGEAYHATLRRALAVNFPTLARAVSAADFDALAAAYVRRYPPSGHDFRRLGAALEGFLRSYMFAAEYGVEPIVFAETVALEQAQLDVSDAIDEEATGTPERLAAISPAQWDDVRFDFVRAVRIVRTTHDVLAAIEAVGREEVPPRPVPAPGAYLVYRADGALRTERLREAEASVLEALIAGHTFRAACVAAWTDAAAADAARVSEAVRMLLRVCARGLILRVRPPDTTAERHLASLTNSRLGHI